MRSNDRLPDRAVAETRDGRQNAATACSTPRHCLFVGADGAGGCAGGPRATNGGRGQAAQTGARFQTLNVQPDANGITGADAAQGQDSEDLARLVPAGFRAERPVGRDCDYRRRRRDEPDRGLMNGRLQAINAGQLDSNGPGGFNAAGGFEWGSGGPGGFNGSGGPGGFNGQGGPGAFNGPGGFGRGGPGGPGGFCARGARRARAEPVSGIGHVHVRRLRARHAPFQLNPNVPATQPQFAQNTFGATFGGPLKIPGIYKDTNRRTNFQVNYTGKPRTTCSISTRPCRRQAMRNGDFSGSPIQLIDPRDRAAVRRQSDSRVRRWIRRRCTCSGSFRCRTSPARDRQNYHVSTTAHSSSDSFSLRLTQNLSPTVPAERPRRLRRSGGGGGGSADAAGFGGRRPAAAARTSSCRAQLQYRRNQTRSAERVSRPRRPRRRTRA